MRLKNGSGVALCWGCNSYNGGRLDTQSCNRAHVEMKPNGIHWAVQAQPIRRGGLVGAEEIKPDEVDGFIQALMGADVGSNEEKIEESRDRITGGEITQIPECLPLDVAVRTDERDGSPVLADFPIQVDFSDDCVELSRLPENRKVNPDIWIVPSDIMDVDLAAL